MTPLILKSTFARRALLAAVLAGCSPKSDARIADSVRSGPAARTTATSDSSIARAILDSLSVIAPRGSLEFDTSNVPKDVDPSTVVALVSDSGLVLTDVNQADTTIRVSKGSIAEALTKRSGRVFIALAHFAHIYTQPYPQYSRLDFTSTPTGMTVSVGDTYRVGFLRELRGLRLASIGYYELEGE